RLELREDAGGGPGSRARHGRVCDRAQSVLRQPRPRIARRRLVLDLRRIREEPDRIVERLSRRGGTDYRRLIDELLQLDEQRRAVIAEVDRLRARRNEVSPQVGKLKQAGRHEEAEPLIREMRELGDRMAAQEQQRSELENAVRDALLAIPNLPEDAVPAGGEEANGGGGAGPRRGRPAGGGSGGGARGAAGRGREWGARRGPGLGGGGGGTRAGACPRPRGPRGGGGGGEGGGAAPRAHGGAVAGG